MLWRELEMLRVELHTILDELVRRRRQDQGDSDAGPNLSLAGDPEDR